MIQIMSYTLDRKRHRYSIYHLRAFVECGRKKLGRAYRSGVMITWWRFYCAFSDVPAVLYAILCLTRSYGSADTPSPAEMGEQNLYT